MKAFSESLILAAFLLSSCNQSASYSTLMPVALDTVPKTFENPNSPTLPVDVPAVPVIPVAPAAQTEKPAPPVDEGMDSNEPQKSEAAPTEENQLSTLVKPSLFIKNTDWIMVHEGQRIGTPCNLFLRRVLEYSGFSGQDFLANDFDLYARKNFRFYKAVDFKNDATGSDIARLKEYLWSYAERTPFIMQWSRSGMHGHIAIVERVKDHLIIYQANLNKYTARKDQTTVQSLLSGFNRRTLTVYSEFK